jgi:hypothetical protein
VVEQPSIHHPLKPKNGFLINDQISATIKNDTTSGIIYITLFWEGATTRNSSVAVRSLKCICVGSSVVANAKHLVITKITLGSTIYYMRIFYCGIINMNTTKKNSNLLCIIAIVVFLLVLGVAFIMIIKSEKWAPPLEDQGFLGLADPGQMLRCNGVQLGAMETKGCGECSRAAEACLRHPLHGDKCRHALGKCADSNCELRSMMNRCSIGRSPDYSRGGTPQAQCPSCGELGESHISEEYRGNSSEGASCPTWTCRNKFDCGALRPGLAPAYAACFPDAIAGLCSADGTCKCSSTGLCVPKNPPAPRKNALTLFNT